MPYSWGASTGREGLPYSRQLRGCQREGLKECFSRERVPSKP